MFNTRRPVFADARVREALSLMFDFEWANRNLFFGVYRRSDSLFADSELSAAGRPMDERERALAERLKANCRRSSRTARGRRRPRTAPAGTATSRCAR